MFVVDLTALKLPQAALEDIQSAINATVQKKVASLNLLAPPHHLDTQQPPPWYGIIYIPPPN